jgi:hypothetical protein
VRERVRVGYAGGPRIDALATGTDFQVKRHGEDPRFAGSALRVPGNLLRDRSTDVLPPADLARRHRAYRCRLLMGPSYRADMWAELEADPTLSATALARSTYGSFATAWHVRNDFTLLVGSGPARGASSRLSRSLPRGAGHSADDWLTPQSFRPESPTDGR